MARLVSRWTLVTLVAGSGVYCALAQPWASAAPRLSFATVAVGKGALSAQVTAAGALSARRTVAVGAQASGKVVALHADFNQRVRRGQVIARLDDAGARAELEQGQAEHRQAEAARLQAEVALRDAEQRLARQRALLAQQLVAAALVEDAETARELAEAELAAARARVRQAAAGVARRRLQLGYTVITSPIDGVVLARSIDVGQTVAASLQAPTLFTIAEDLALMQIEAAVAEADIGRLAAGQRARFTVDAYPGKRLEGTVRQVRNAPTTVQGVVTYVAVIDVGNPEGILRPGMTANVTFVLEEVADAVTIPNPALRLRLSAEQIAGIEAEYGAVRGADNADARAGQGGARGGARGARGERGERRGGGRRERQAVWKLENGKPKMVMIRPGLSDGSATQMLEGELRPADLLITEIRGLPSASSPRKVSAF
jgi:HlyD family secretion protein